MPEKSKSNIEVFQTYSSDDLPQDLQHLIRVERGETKGLRTGRAIVTLKGLRREFPETSPLIENGWSEAFYQADIASYGEAALKGFVWGWHSPDADRLESRFPEEVAKAETEANDHGAKVVGITSGLVVYRHEPYGSYEVAAHTNYGEPKAMLVKTSLGEAEDVMYRAVRHQDPVERDAITRKPRTTVLGAEGLVPKEWLAIEGLHDAMDARFVELLEDHQVN